MPCFSEEKAKAQKGCYPVRVPHQQGGAECVAGSKLHLPLGVTFPTRLLTLGRDRKPRQGQKHLQVFWANSEFLFTTAAFLWKQKAQINPKV